MRGNGEITAEDVVNGYLQRACELLGEGSQSTQMQTIMVAVMLQNEEMQRNWQRQNGESREEG